MSTVRNEPYNAMNFEVVIEGVLDDGRSAKAAFSEVSGLGIDIGVIEYRTGAESATVRKMPGLTKFSNLTLKRGLIGDATLFNWLKSVTDGQAPRANGFITLLDEARRPVVRWRFRNAWPCKWEGPTLNAAKNEVAVETVELCIEGLEMVE